MPLFDWQSNPKTVAVGHNFWIYWAATVPLTVVVLVAWVICFPVMLVKYNKEDSGAQSSSFLDLISRKRDKKDSNDLKDSLA
jgi:hypothetical protein